MRTIKNLAVPQNSDAKFPFSTILNDTDTNDGTPVVEEIYGDVLTNIYKLLQTVGIVPTGTQDNDITQYQILEALQILPNLINGSEYVLTLAGSVWSIPLKIELLPDKYFFIARASEAYVNGASYTFKGSGVTSYPFSSAGFKASDELLVIIDQSGVRAYSLSFLETASENVFTPMGLPIAFNDSNKMYYQSDGNLVSDTPSINDLQSIIRVEVSNGTVLVNDMFISNGFVICFCLIPSTNTFFFRQFELIDLSESFAVSLVGTVFGNSSNFTPYVYAKQGAFYITNSMNTSANDYAVTKLSYNPGTAQMTFVSSVNLDASFVKTSNSAVKLEKLYTLITGVLTSYDLGSGTKVVLGNYGSINGNLFGFNGNVYFGSGEVAKIWNL
jgi:hypothetical protein